MNKVDDPYTATVNGKRTGLAGCKNIHCDKRAYCLRADEQLRCRVMYKQSGDGSCNAWIAIEDGA